MKFEKGNRVRIINNNPDRCLGLKPGMEGIVELHDERDDTCCVKWPCGIWWVYDNIIKVIKP
jgi:hypothetical protein